MFVTFKSRRNHSIFVGIPIFDRQFYVYIRANPLEAPAPKNHMKLYMPWANVEMMVVEYGGIWWNMVEYGKDTNISEYLFWGVLIATQRILRKTNSCQFPIFTCQTRSRSVSEHGLWRINCSVRRCEWKGRDLKKFPELICIYLLMIVNGQY